MIQVRPFIIGNAGTKPYWCLQNVRLGYGIGPKHAFALQDWQNNIQHPDQNYPAGCSVPVYWSWFGTVDGVYKDWGHIAVRLADGRIWTDGRYYADVGTLNANYLGGKGKYLGWGELVESVKVVTQGDNMAETISDDSARQIGYHYLGRNGYDGKPNALQAPQGDLQGQPLSNAKLSEFFLSAESRDWRDNRLPKLFQERDNLRGEVTRLTSSNQELTDTVARQNGEIIGLNQTINGQKLEISELSEQVKKLTAENIALKKQLEDCGSTPPPTPETDSVVITKDSLWTTFVNWVNKVFKNGK